MVSTPIEGIEIEPDFIKNPKYPSLGKNVGDDPTDKWINRSLRFCPEGEIYLKDVFECYQDVFTVLNLIPESKITFSRKVKEILKDELKNGTVKYVRRSRYLLKGVCYIDVDTRMFYNLGVPAEDKY